MTWLGNDPNPSGEKWCLALSKIYGIIGLEKNCDIGFFFGNRVLKSILKNIIGILKDNFNKYAKS